MNKIYRLSNNKQETNLEGINKQKCLINFLSIFGSDDLIIVADNVKDETIETVKKLGIKASDIYRTSLGNSKSFIYAADIAKTFNDDDIIYFVEDDYLHLENSPELILEGIQLADYVSLYDHLDKYLDKGENNPYPNQFVKDGGEDTKVIISKSTHWKFTNSTTMTFAMRVGILKEDYEIMKRYCVTAFPHDFEMFCELREKKNRKIITSIPGRSTHCDSRYASPFTRWENVS